MRQLSFGLKEFKIFDIRHNLQGKNRADTEHGLTRVDQPRSRTTSKGVYFERLCVRQYTYASVRIQNVYLGFNPNYLRHYSSSF